MSESNKILRGAETDLEFENKIRPQELDSFNGQDKIIENLRSPAMLKYLDGCVQTDS